MVDIKSNYSRLFWISITGSSILKFFLAYFFPLTGDEAYFITSGKFFDLGYYEHPPLIWWIIYISSFFGRYTFHFFYYRLFSIFTTLLIGYLIFILLKTEEEKRYLISSFFLLSPVYLLSFLITNDIPLLFFTFLSGIFFYKGIKEERKIDFIISGTFFGLAFLSKYLSILYLIGVFVYVTLRNEKKLWKNFFVFFAFSLPLIFINLYWNYTHCWINVLFNLVYRRKTEYFKIKNIILFFLSIFFLLTPYFFYIFSKEKFFIKKKFKEGYDFFFFIFFVPTLFLFFISFLRRVGLHWYISFIPFSFLLLTGSEKDKIIKCIKTAFYFNGIIILIIISLLFVPVEKFKNHKKYSEIIMFKNPYPICNYFKKFNGQYIFATPGYTESAIMSYYCKKDFIVFGDLGHSGREYDISFDFKKIEGKDILIFSTFYIDQEKYLEFFEEIKMEEIIIKGAKFYLLFCKKFNYKNYRDKVLRKTYEKFYKIPEFLPKRGNFFKEKYNL